MLRQDYFYYNYSLFDTIIIKLSDKVELKKCNAYAHM